MGQPTSPALIGQLQRDRQLAEFIAEQNGTAISKNFTSDWMATNGFKINLVRK